MKKPYRVRYVGDEGDVRRLIVWAKGHRDAAAVAKRQGVDEIRSVRSVSLVWLWVTLALVAFGVLCALEK